MDSLRRTGTFALLLISVACESVSPRPPFPTVAPWHGEPSEPRLEKEPTDPERELWKEAGEAVDALEKSGDLLDDDSIRAYVQALVENLAPPVRDGGPKLRPLVLVDSTRNAAALPDGTLLLTLGMIAALENEAELAMVIGHEVAHVLLRHSLIQSRYDELTSSHVDRMRLSRELERRADDLGLRLVLALGYPADAAIHALEQLEQGSPSTASLVKSWESHQDLDARRAHLFAVADRFEPPPPRAEAEAFERISRAIRLLAAELALADDRIPVARALIDRMLAADPERGRAYYLRAETTRRLHPEKRLDAAVRGDYERAVELSPRDADALRALGLSLWDTGAMDRARPLLRRYLEVRPDAVDRKIIERYLATAPR